MSANLADTMPGDAGRATAGYMSCPVGNRDTGSVVSGEGGESEVNMIAGVTLPGPWELNAGEIHLADLPGTRGAGGGASGCGKTCSRGVNGAGSLVSASMDEMDALPIRMARTWDEVAEDKEEGGETSSPEVGGEVANVDTGELTDRVISGLTTTGDWLSDKEPG